MDAPQAKFDGIVREAEVQFLEATIDHLRSKVKDHQEAIGATTANIDGTIERWKEQLLKNDISNAKATSLVEAAVAFVEKLSKDTAVSRASKALQAEISRTAKNRSQAMMDDSEVFVPSEESIRDIIRNELRGLTSGTSSPNEETGSGKFPYPKEGIMASRKASHVEVDPQVVVKPSNAKGQPLPNGLTDLKSGQKTPEEKVQAT